MIFQILSHTPIWVFALFAALLVFGFIQTRNRNVGKFLAFLFPIGMIVLSLSGVQSSFGFKPAPIALWAAGLAIVTVVGYKYFPSADVIFDSSSNAFFIPGSWIPFYVIMAIFFIKYVFGVARALNPDVTNSAILAMTLSLLYGCLSGYFAARAANLVVCARKAQPAVQADRP